MAPSRGFTTLLSSRHSFYTFQQCRSHAFATTPALLSGHNRWSKIKHDKGKADAAKNRQRSVFAQEIATASRLFGPEPNGNPKLADLIAKAKKEGFAKASIEAAIARGQGRSLSGASLESVTVEGILPNNVAVIVECETDSKLRTLAEVKLAIKESGGSATPTSYLFQKKGRVVFDRKIGIGVDEVLEPALDAGALDVEEDDEGSIIVFTNQGNIKAVGESIAQALSLDIARSEIVWAPNEDTKVDVSGEEAAQELSSFVEDLQEKEQTVQAVAMNVAQGSLSADAWRDLQSRIMA